MPTVFLSILLMTVPFGSWSQDPEPSVQAWGGCLERVSMDRLNPAHVFTDEPVELAQTPSHCWPPSLATAGSQDPTAALGTVACQSVQSKRHSAGAAPEAVERSRFGRMIRPQV